MLKICLVLLLLQNAIICENITTNSSQFFLMRAKRSNTCGLSFKSKGFIVGGNDFEKGTYPWMAALLLDDSKKTPSYFCGGVLISSKKVLSAAHCFLDKSQHRRKLTRDVIILLGAHDLQNLFDPHRISRSPKQIIIHPDWNPRITSYDGDISVLLIEEEVHFTSAIQPICLWTSNNDPLSTEGIVIGYGKSEDKTKLHETLPKQLKIPIISNNEDCFLREPKFASISSKRTFCASSTDGSGPCLGDSGHGLFIKQENIFYLRGLVSSSFIAGSSCDTSKYTVFTNVLKYKNWINNPSDEYDIPSYESIIDSKTTQKITKRPQLHGLISYNNNACGIMSNFAKLIQGGEFSKQIQFPWMAIIKFKDDNGIWSHYGSGSLISQKHVFAESSSVSYYDLSRNFIPVGADRVKILLGTTKYDDLNQSGSIEVGVKKIVNYPNSREVLPTLDINKVSVITLDREIAFSEFIRPVCLWPFNGDFSKIVGRDAYAVGYGNDQAGSESLIRKHVRMTVTGIDQTCRSTFLEELAFQFETNLFCVKGNDNETPCFRDYQLYMKVESKWYLKGNLGSFKYFENGTCNSIKPGLCEDITRFVPWIQNQIY